MSSLSVIVLAAGFGKRMKSKLPKVLHKVCGKTLIDNVLDVVEEIAETPTVVIGHNAELVEKQICHKSLNFALQEEQLGTGHAVMSAKEFIPTEGNVLVLYGDTPLLRKETLQSFIEFHEKNECKVSVMTTKMQDPSGYGRIVRDAEGNFEKIVEDKDANDIEKAIDEINSGTCCFDAAYLNEALNLLKNDNSQGEYYLTDAIEIIKEKAGFAGAFILDDPTEVMGINDRLQLNLAETIMKNRILDHHMINGVTIIDRNSTVIGYDVVIGGDTVVLPGSYIMGKTTIGEDCIIGPVARITDSKVGNAVEIKDSTVLESEIDDRTKVGPYAYLRPNSKVGSDVKVGDFVEIKNSNIGNGTKISHLAYVGDGDVGEGCNISCGVIFTNYDGKNKSRCTVGDNAFVGCNVNLVAPVTISEGAYIAAGSTITEDVPADSLAIARSRQTVKVGWNKKKRK